MSKTATASPKRPTSNVQRPTPNGGIKSRAEFETLLKGIVIAQLEKEKLEGARDAQILKARNIFDPQISVIAKRMEESVQLAEQYATEYREELLPEKTGSTGFASFGFRLSPPALVLFNDKWTWDKVVEAIKKSCGKLADALIVTKEAPDKNAIKKLLSEKELNRIGIRLESTDRFFIEPKRDPKDPRRLAAV